MLNSLITIMCGSVNASARLQPMKEISIYRKHKELRINSEITLAQNLEHQVELYILKDEVQMQKAGDSVQ